MMTEEAGMIGPDDLACCGECGAAFPEPVSREQARRDFPEGVANYSCSDCSALWLQTEESA